jgi:hypothetical protein
LLPRADHREDLIGGRLSLRQFAARCRAVTDFPQPLNMRPVSIPLRRAPDSRGRMMFPSASRPSAAFQTAMISWSASARGLRASRRGVQSASGFDIPRTPWQGRVRGGGEADTDQVAVTETRASSGQIAFGFLEIIGDARAAIFSPRTQRRCGDARWSMVGGAILGTDALATARPVAARQRRRMRPVPCAGGDGRRSGD